MKFNGVVVSKVGCKGGIYIHLITTNLFSAICAVGAVFASFGGVLGNFGGPIFLFADSCCNRDIHSDIAQCAEDIGKGFYGNE